VGQDLENRVEDLKKELAEAKAKKAPVDDVAKRAAVEGISVEELTKREAAVEREAKLNIARSEQRKLDALKGKTDKRSVAERKNIKQFIEDLKTMSVEEARAKRQPSAREQRVAANEYDLKSLKKVGEGSTRVVYDLGDGRVLKRAKNPRGLMQNDAIRWGDKNEILLELLPEVYFDEEGADYVIHENVPRNDSAVRKFLKPLKEVYDENRIPGDRYIHPKVMRQMEEMGLGEFLNYDLLMGDFVRPSSWGQRENGEFVLVDDGTLSASAMEYKFGKLLPVSPAYQEAWNEVKSLRSQPKAREQRVDVEAEGPNIVYRSGAVDSKAESRYRMSGGRSTGHFGTGAYFFSDRESAEAYDDRDVTAVDISDYNLAPATYSLHDALAFANMSASRVEFDNQLKQESKPHTITMEEVRLVEAANRIERKRGGINIKRDDNGRRIPVPDLYDVVFDKYYRMMLPTADAKRIAAEATRLYNEPGNIDSASTSIMKALGYEGVNAVGTELDNSTYGTVIYDVKTEPKAREQRVDVDNIEQQLLDARIEQKRRGEEWMKESQKRERGEANNEAEYLSAFEEARKKVRFLEDVEKGRVRIDEEQREKVVDELSALSGDVRKGELIREDEDLSGIYEVEVDGMLFRGVSLEDFRRIQESGFINTDLRGVISEREGINLAQSPATAFYYLPLNGPGVVMAIDVSDKSGLFAIGADNYVRSSKPIPTSDIKFVTNPNIEGYFMPIVEGEVDNIEVVPFAPEQPFTAREQRTELSQSEIDERNAGVPESRNMPYKDAPSRMYHVTFAGKAIRKAGKLLASSGLGTGGIGGTESVGVSFYDNASDAEVLRNELDLISQANAIENEEEAQAFIDRLQESKGRSFQENYNLRRKVDDKVSDSLREVLRLERMRVNGPVIFREKTLPANQSPEIIEASKEDIPESTRILRGVDKNEVRVLSNVTVRERGASREAPRAAEQRVETGTPFTFEYNKNLERAPQRGTQFGQDVEAAGDYVTQSVGFTPEGFETGAVTVQSPLVSPIDTEELLGKR
jgi:hypothetical protein